MLTVHMSERMYNYMDIKRLSTKGIVTSISVTLCLVIACVVFLGFVLAKHITIVDLDSEIKTTTRAKTVADVLYEKDITLNEGDKIDPPLEYEIQNNTNITITRAKKIKILADGGTLEELTCAKTVSDALSEAGITIGEFDEVSYGLDENIKNDMVIEIKRAMKVTVTVDGQTHERYTAKATVADFLNDVAIYLEQYDEITPYLETKIEDGLIIVISRVTVENSTYEEAVAPNVIKKSSDEYAQGKSVVSQEGADGVSKNTYRIVKKNGEIVSKTLLNSEAVKKPVDKIVINGTKKTPAISSRGGIRYKKVVKCSATAYDPGVQSNGAYPGKTATGRTAAPGIVAVDPRVIPLNSRLYIESTDDGKSWTYGYAIAGDTGGAIKGNKIDLCFSTIKECYQFGRRQCNVYILE